MDFSKFIGKKVVWAGTFQSREDSDVKNSYVLYESGSGFVTSESDGEILVTELEDAKGTLNVVLAERLEEAKSVFTLGQALGCVTFGNWWDSEITKVLHKKSDVLRALRSLSDIGKHITATDYYRASLGDRAKPKGTLQTGVGSQSAYYPAEKGLSDSEKSAAIELQALMAGEDELVDEGAAILADCKARGVVVEECPTGPLGYPDLSAYLDNIEGKVSPAELPFPEPLDAELDSGITYPITDIIQEIPIRGVVGDEPKP